MNARQQHDPHENDGHEYDRQEYDLRDGDPGGATGDGPRSHLHSTLTTMRDLQAHLPAVERWGTTIGRVLADGGRLLAAGNGGSAAQAQHLTAELVGRYLAERRPLSAIALHAETSSLTAIANDYGPEAAFARQVEAHGRPGDVLVLLSTSGRSPNVVAAAQRARAIGMSSLAVTGRRPNPLAGACDDCIAVDATRTAVVQEAHLVILHLLCEAVDRVILGAPAAAVAGPGDGRSAGNRSARTERPGPGGPGGGR